MNVKKGAGFILAACHLLVSVVWAVAPSTAMAQADIDPPKIDMDATDEGILGDRQVFSAVVVDDTGLAKVVLHYRFNSNTNYSAISMEAIGGTDVYTVSLETAGEDTDLVQYYVEAQDIAGNQTLRGFAFDPLERPLVSADLLTEAAPQAGSTAPAMSTSRKVLYGVLGLAVVAALAGASGGAGSSGSSGGAGAEIPLTVVVPGSVQ